MGKMTALINQTATNYQDIQPDINQIQPISGLCIYEYERLGTYRARMSHNTKLY